MRYNYIVIAALLTATLLSCGTRTKKNEKQTVAVEHTATEHDGTSAASYDMSFLDYFEKCEEVARWFESDEDLRESLEESDADDAFQSWNVIKDLCQRRNLKSVASMLEDKEFEGNLITYLRNSTAHYLYFTVIKNQILNQVDSLQARKELIDDMGYCLVMTDYVVLLNEEKNGYVPPHYKSLIHDYFLLLLEEGEYEKAEPLADKLYRYSILDGMDETEARYNKLRMEVLYADKACSRDVATEKIYELYEFLKTVPGWEDEAEALGKILSE